MANTKIHTKKSNRIHWMDNLRTLIILLVVLYHTGGVYESAGLWGWFWIVDDPTTIIWVGIMGIMFDVFMMTTLFLISGYLAAASLKNKTAWDFIVNKFKRLMVPWAVAVFTLIPLYKVIFLYSRGLPQEHWTTYFHITNANSQKWLWFLPLLFVFNLGYLLISRLKIRITKISMKVAVPVISLLGLAYAYFSGILFGFRSWTSTPLLDFENERLLVYFLSFLLGVLCYRQKVFAELPKSKTLYIVASSVAWLPVTAHIFARLFPFFYPEGFEVTLLYMLIWHLTFYLALVCMVYVMVESFRLYIDRTGSVWNWLNRNSYGVYIVHVILIGVFATLLLNTGLPAMVKYPVVFISSYLGSNLLVSLYRNARLAITSSTRKVPSQMADIA